MGRWARRRHRPSDAARHRLVEAMRRDRAELEVQVAEGLLRSELYLETGQPRRAAEVLEEQRRRVEAFEGHVRDAIAAASVEAEAEAVLAGADGVDALHAEAPLHPGRAPQLVAACAAILAVVAATLGSSMSDGNGGLRASASGALDSSSAGAGEAVRTPKVAPDHLRFRGYGSGTGTSGAGSDAAGGRGDAAADARDALLGRLGVDVRVGRGVLLELEGLVATLMPGNPLTDRVWLQVLSEAAGATSRHADTEDGDAAPRKSEAEDDGTWFAQREGSESRSDQDETGTPPSAPDAQDGTDGDQQDGTETTPDGSTTPDAADGSSDDAPSNDDGANDDATTPNGVPGASGVTGALR